MAKGPTLTMPAVPALGLPAGEKDAGQRVDFKPSKFDLMIENKGYLLAWTRACWCPCTPIATQTKSADPNCSLCNGTGWIYFGGNVTQDFDVEQWDLDVIQKKIIADSNAMVIRGVISGIGAKHEPYDKLGNWVEGAMQVTVRPENKLAYYDQLVCLDAEIGYSEILIANGSTTTAARYLITGINYLRSIATVYTADTHFQINTLGQVEWLSGNEPAVDTRLAIHYLCHPQYLVIEHPHVIRMTSKKFKTAKPKTPMGDPKALPIQAVVRYDFLPRST